MLWKFNVNDGSISNKSDGQVVLSIKVINLETFTKYWDFSHFIP